MSRGTGGGKRHFVGQKGVANWWYETPGFGSQKPTLTEILGTPPARIPASAGGSHCSTTRVAPWQQHVQLNVERSPVPTPAPSLEPRSKGNVCRLRYGRREEERKARKLPGGAGRPLPRRPRSEAANPVCRPLNNRPEQEAGSRTPSGLPATATARAASRDAPPDLCCGCGRRDSARASGHWGPQSGSPRAGGAGNSRPRARGRWRRTPRSRARGPRSCTTCSSPRSRRAAAHAPEVCRTRA
mmetsp:Transcript_60841/g.100621  ORF Transcript_60841/g.100621 Transcript_60841/m.100621 type:complete len:242 (+) Transcript_60841:561-1286(+)